MRSDQAQHLDHLARAAGLTVPLDKLGQQPIITGRPESALPPRRQRLRTDQPTRLAFQHVEIMCEIEHLLMAFVAALVTCEGAAFIADLDVARMEPHRDRLTNRK